MGGESLWGGLSLHAKILATDKIWGRFKQDGKTHPEGAALFYGLGKNKKEEGARGGGARLESEQKPADLHKFQASQGPHIESLSPDGGGAGYGILCLKSQHLGSGGRGQEFKIILG